MKKLATVIYVIGGALGVLSLFILLYDFFANNNPANASQLSQILFEDGIELVLPAGVLLLTGRLMS